jgi:non-specific serine/threonine protein kinase
VDTPVLSFASWLKRQRRSHDWTQEELAVRIGCAPVTLRKLESGERRPSKEIAQRIAEIFDVPEADRPRFMAFARAVYPVADAAPVPPPEIPAVPIPPVRPATELPARYRSLPIQLTSFVGREREIVSVTALLGQARLLTLTGAGGCGKTRLALEVAARLATDSHDAFPDGIWLVDLARLADSTLVPQAIASSLGIRDEALRPLLDQLVDYCAPRRLLLLLDNCEHLIAACAFVADALLRASAGLRILATSREPLAIGGEATFHVPSLQSPDPLRLPPFDDAIEYEAVRLFRERAESVRPGFEVTPANLPVVAEICQRLDGMPLAIELAAARTRVLTVDDISARLGDRFQLLTGGSRVALPRHQTLRATIEWSYALLSDADRALLRHLAVFAGGWTLPAAEAVCAPVAGVGGNVLDLLAHLVDKSLVVSGWRGHAGRYGMLETLRQFALEQLEAGGEGAAARGRHAAYFVELAEAAEPKLMSTEQRAWQISLAAEHNNIQVALDWLASPEAEAVVDRPRELGLRLAGALWRYWEVRGSLAEGQAHLEPLLAGSTAGIDPAVLARAHLGAGVCAFYRGDFAAATARYEESVRLYRAVGDRRALTRPLTYLGWMDTYRTDFARARGELEEALALSRELGDSQAEAWATARLGIVAYWAGDPEKGIPLLERALALSRELGDELGTGWWLLMLGQATFAAGQTERTVELLEECLVCTEALGDRRDHAFALTQLSVADLGRGDPAQATARLNEAASIFRELGDGFGITAALFGYAFTLASFHPLAAIRIGGAVTTACQAGGFAFPLGLVVMFDNLLAGLKDGVGAGAFAAEWEAGSRLPLEAALAQALALGRAVAGA